MAHQSEMKFRKTTNKRAANTEPNGHASKRRALGDLTNQHAVPCGVSTKQAETRQSPIKRNIFADVPAQDDLDDGQQQQIHVPAPTQAPTFIDIDADQQGDPVTTYINDIYDNLRDQEITYPPNFLHCKQTEITAHHRGILIDWLNEVAQEYHLASDTLFLCKAFVDGYLAKRFCRRDRLQLAGITCLLIAAKMEEVYPPGIDEFVYITDNTYTRAEIVHMEADILHTLEFKLVLPTEKLFLRRFLKAVSATVQGVHLTRLTMLANYLCEMSLQEAQFVVHRQSVVAAASVMIAAYVVLGNPYWSTTLEHYTQLSATDDELVACRNALFVVFQHSQQSPLRAVYNKYAQQRFLEVALIAAPPVPVSWR